MPEFDLNNQGDGARDAQGRFRAGRSGNLAGKPKGCLAHATRAARLLLAGEGEGLTRTAVQLALTGDRMALRLCLERILGPCRERAVEFAMPKIDGAEDVAPAMAALAAATAQGLVTPREATELSRIIDAYVRAIDATEFDRRLTALEVADAAR